MTDEAPRAPVKTPNVKNTLPPRRVFHFLPAFWTVASILSLAVNVILIGVLLGVGNQLFTAKRLIQDQLVGGLYQNFQQMDNATIQASIPVSDSVQAQFPLVIDKDTTVTLSQDTKISKAQVTLISGGVYINSPADIVLPSGTQLPIHLNLTVEVNQQIPVNLNVKVNIPLNKTDLHQPFVGLQNVVQPYYNLLQSMPDSWENAICGKQPSAICKLMVP